jgi:hypothetical protein
MITAEVEQEYIQIFDDYIDNPCANTTIPPWNDVKQMVSAVITIWLRNVACKVSEACNQKIEVYEKYLPKFEEADDDYRIGIVKKLYRKKQGLRA